MRFSEGKMALGSSYARHYTIFRGAVRNWGGEFNVVPIPAVLHVLRNPIPAGLRIYYCPAQAGLFMPPAQLGSPSDIAIPIMLQGSCIKFMHLK
jgi:hypothetical protein